MRGGLLLLAALAAPAAAQLPADLARERQASTDWLTTSALSPYAAIALQTIGNGLTLGPEPADVPLPGFARAEVQESGGVVTFTQSGTRRILARNRPTPLDTLYRVLVSGGSGRAVLVVYGPLRGAKPPSWYEYVPALAVPVDLEPPDRRGRFRVLGPDGLETEAEEAGLVTVRVAGTVARLRVYRLGTQDDDEAELQVFFRDGTNRAGSYPAGRFVELLPLGGRRYRLDFNRARNPFCAYSTVFPCPAPWPGNQVAAPIPAGERYSGGGLEPD